ncbi:CEI_1a_G0037640.mRNA.1.CDS.1 [Saccharomyces cerevisiae]|nr:EM14S01-3B_G0039500.mRNA.1.CDS.1 [Saccharomyces cerevisiae]CAI4700140.1 AMH_1a_G0037770.mRNA.1.CDS.1 [Saccharomyces cerevisiae]CAI4700403.1 CEI_1a_G0037640.mRNA.1.CDS.1 [Saccharomyces cerevisiae]CAI6843550.1 AMH_1a_G0037770.mRNA.1.CDS.1 [Saccharomyces cerevisiae]CAI7430440.1 CEI_1a_G0037640.mRNA.1.CDS.1 [Saccharomyces cerevisiae]
MIRLPRLYQRYLLYLVVLVVIALFYFLQAPRVKEHIGFDLALPISHVDNLWFQNKGLEGFSNDDKLVVNIGYDECFHIGRFYEGCFNRHELKSTLTDGHQYLQRKRIHKDLRGSFGRRWFGKSEYLYYDVLYPALVHYFGSNLEKLNVEAVTGISRYPKDKSLPFMDVSITFEPISIELLRKRSYISDINILFGVDCIQPIANWTLQKEFPLVKYRYSEPAYLTYKFVGTRPVDTGAQRLQETDEGKFKIVQLADLHLGVGESECIDEYPKHEACKADPKTETFVQQVLDIEKPQLVVFTGDQIMGDRSIQDSETVLLKAVAPVIARKIPWAMVWGNHDDEGSLTRWQLSEIASVLPYSLFKFSPHDTHDNTFGVGNYIYQIFSNNDTEVPVGTLYFLDSHKYSTVGKIYPGYDWIKESQWKYIEDYHDVNLKFKTGLSMAFFHIPLPEYLNIESKTHPGEKNPLIGMYKEGVTAPKYNSEGITTLDRLSVDVVSCGHDHCNDYCLRDDSTPNKIWLCYGGGGGEGGYAGYGGTERRIRIYEINVNENNIHTWKRLNGSPKEIFDFQSMLDGNSLESV